MALSADRILDFLPGGRDIVGVEAGETIYKGALVASSVSGHAAAQTLVQARTFLGVSLDAEVDNSAGIDDDLEVKIQVAGAVYLTNSSADPITAAMIGTAAYAEDDQKVRMFVSGGVNVGVGIIRDVDSTLGVKVDLNVAPALPVVADLGDISATNGDFSTSLAAPYNETTTGAGAPSQTEMVAAFGAAADGATGVIFDDTPGVAYFCYAEATTGWYYCTATVGA